MRCPDNSEWITRYAAGELDRDAKSELEDHLADCASCREELTLAARLEELLEGGSPAASPPGLVDRIMTAVDREEQESLEREVASIAFTRKSWRPGKAFLPSLCFAFTVIFVSVGMGIGWSSFYGSLSALAGGLSGVNIDFTVPRLKGGVAENLNLAIAGFMMLASLCVVFAYMIPVRIRWRDIVQPF